MALSVAAFVAVGIALAFSAWAAWQRDPSATVTALFERAMSDRLTRIAILLAWWWLGWHFLAGQTTETPLS